MFHRLLDRFARTCSLERRDRPGAARPPLANRWPRIHVPPYLRPHLFREYVVGYDAPVVKAIQRTGGFARIHSHGRLRLILDDIASTGCDGLDPIEPPPQGDVTLAEVRERHGQQMVLFGNLEASDIENLAAENFTSKVGGAPWMREPAEGHGWKRPGLRAHAFFLPLWPRPFVSGAEKL